jgi:hypothetical protein
MPYIEQKYREEIGECLLGRQPLNAGELNYVLTSIINAYLEEDLTGRKGYSKLNEIIGVLECAKLELYRRVCVPYENDKIHQNGDVYTVKCSYGDVFTVKGK